MNHAHGHNDLNSLNGDISAKLSYDKVMSKTKGIEDNEVKQDGQCEASCQTDKQFHQTQIHLGEKETIHGAHISEVHYVPMSVIIRPIPSILDEEKVVSIMATLQVSE